MWGATNAGTSGALKAEPLPGGQPVHPSLCHGQCPPLTCCVQGLVATGAVCTGQGVGRPRDRCEASSCCVRCATGPTLLARAGLAPRASAGRHPACLPRCRRQVAVFPRRSSCCSSTARERPASTSSACGTPGFALPRTGELAPGPAAHLPTTHAVRSRALAALQSVPLTNAAMPRACCGAGTAGVSEAALPGPADKAGREPLTWGQCCQAPRANTACRKLSLPHTRVLPAKTRSALHCAGNRLLQAMLAGCVPVIVQVGARPAF